MVTETKRFSINETICEGWCYIHIVQRQMHDRYSVAEIQQPFYLYHMGLLLYYKTEEIESEESFFVGLLFLIQEIHFENQCCNRLNVLIEYIWTNLIWSIQFDSSPSTLFANKYSIAIKGIAPSLTCKVLKPILPGDIDPYGMMVKTNLLFAAFDDNSICLK